MIARGTGYVKASRASAYTRLAAHLKYIEHRSRSEGETRESRRIFGKEADHASRRVALADVMAHTSSAVSFHKIVLSPGENEPVQDWHAWTREVMADLEEHQGRELHWYAVQHNNTNHPHIHVVLAGGGEHLVTGRPATVKMVPHDYALLRESGRTHSEHDWYERVQEMVQELDRTDPTHPVDTTLDRPGESLNHEEWDQYER